MDVDPISVELLEKHCAGDDRAADLIFERYAARLVGLVRKQLFSNVNRRVDAEDVAQSTFRSFFRHADSDRFVIERSDDLWRLLAAIAVNKARRQNEFHTAAKRAVNQECGGDSVLEFDPTAVAGEPAPGEVMELAEELETVLTNLKLPVHREMVELRLAGRTVEEIAEAVGRTERSVRRVLNQVRDDLEQRLRPGDDG